LTEKYALKARHSNFNDFLTAWDINAIAEVGIATTLLPPTGLKR
jgi:hypothetical protein